MATNRYFDNTGLGVVDGTIAKASQVNALTNETNTAFDLIQSELDSITVGALLSYQWANNDQGDLIDPTNYPGQYSSRAYAEESEAWSIGKGGVDTEADGVTAITQSSKEGAEAAKVSEDSSRVRTESLWRTCECWWLLCSPLGNRGE